MASYADKHDRDDDVSTEKKLDDLYELIEDMEVCMMTTRRFDGRLVSRPMALQQRKEGTADLWFMTSTETEKLDELEPQPDVNLGFYNSKTREWVSVSGRARVSQHKGKIRELYKPDWKAWLGDRGGEMDGGPNDPRIALIFVEAHSVEYLKKDRPALVQLFSFAKAMVTGDPPKMGDQRSVTPKELPHESGRELR